MANNSEKKYTENELDSLELVSNEQDESADDGFKFLGDPNYTPNVKKQPERSAFGKLIPIISLACVFGVLIGGYFIMKKLFPATDTDSVYDITEEQNGEDVIELAPGIIGNNAERLEIKNQLDEFTFVRRLQNTYYIEGKEDLKLTGAKVLSALTYAGSVKASSKVQENVTNWEEYGLATPIATVRWTQGEKTHYFEIGDTVPTGNQNLYYLRFNGTDTLYTMTKDAVEMFTTKRMDYYDTTVFAFDSNTDGPYITNFTIYSKKLGETVVADLQDLTSEDLGLTAYVMSAPIEHNFSTEKFELVNSLMSTLTSLTVFSDDISQQNLEKYGLTDPEYTFTFTNVATKNVAHFGKTSDDGYLYMYAEGKDFIYLVDKSAISVLTYDLAAYCDVMSYSRSYDTINSLVIKGGGKTFEVQIAGTADEGNLQAYINNKYVDYENFGTLYAHIISIEVKEIGTKPEGIDPAVTITVYCKDGSVDELKYYKINDVNAFYELNGSGRLIVSTAKVEQILKFAQQLYDGQEIVLDW